MDSNAGNSSKEVEVADQGPHLHPNLGNSVAGRSLDPSVVTETGFEKPFFKMRQAEWWNFIQELNLEQRGALFTLVLNMHLNESPVSNDKTHLAYMFGCHANKAYPIVQHLIETNKLVVPASGKLFCPKVGEAWAERRERSRKAALAGKISGQARRQQSAESSLDDIKF